MVKFMRRQTDADALRIAAGVLLTVAGIVPGGRIDPEQSFPRPLTPQEAAQWEQHLGDEEEETEQAALALECEGYMLGTCFPRPLPPPRSHRRRKMLAQHRKDYLGDTVREEEDDQPSLMKMPRSCRDMDREGLGSGGGRAAGEAAPAGEVRPAEGEESMMMRWRKRSKPDAMHPVP